MTRQRWNFIFAVTLIAAVWGIVLPMLSKSDVVRARRAWLQQQRIDPAAMYYTELPMMDNILDRIDR
ncbi:hypothetical protein NHH03_06575 [Stieleria sp. TO1_6]|uniref:hypothetical protein n=1 Tax=Stieleria tagensis TaxID=2956795 RepID=UPI00209B4A81|nr:hypothetical protein [Stieleria tagensis]MCO8121395.1 hypothetical protein [Stieleria tagensis]